MSFICLGFNSVYFAQRKMKQHLFNYSSIFWQIYLRRHGGTEAVLLIKTVVTLCVILLGAQHAQIYTVWQHC